MSAAIAGPRAGNRANARNRSDVISPRLQNVITPGVCRRCGRGGGGNSTSACLRARLVVARWRGRGSRIFPARSLSGQGFDAPVQVALVAGAGVSFDYAHLDGAVDHRERFGQQLGSSLRLLVLDRAAERADRVPEAASVLLIDFRAPVCLAHPLERGIRIRHLLTGILTESLSFYGTTGAHCIRNDTSISDSTVTGWPSFMAGLNFHCLTASMAFSSSPLPRARATLIFATLPSGSICTFSSTVPWYFAARASSEYSGSTFVINTGAETPLTIR